MDFQADFAEYKAKFRRPDCSKSKSRNFITQCAQSFAQRRHKETPIAKQMTKRSHGQNMPKRRVPIPMWTGSYIKQETN